MKDNKSIKNIKCLPGASLPVFILLVFAVMSLGGCSIYPEIVTETLADGVVGTPYSEFVEAIGTPAPVWSFRGSLPDGLSLNPVTGEISGTPTEPGSFDFTIRLGTHIRMTISKNFTITITDTVTRIIPVSGVTLNKTSTSISKGNTETLTATVAPPDAANKNVTWISSNADVATVSASGVVTAVSNGIANITVTTTDGGYQAVCSVTVFEMVPISGGTFTLGNDDSNYATDKPESRVTLSGFRMSAYEVTQEQYRAVMGNNPSSFTSNPATGEEQARRPVDSVSWYDALVFCNRLSIMEGLSPVYSINGNTNPNDWPVHPSNLSPTVDLERVPWDAVVIVPGSTGYRLPTEAQWEYAAKGGNPDAPGWELFTHSGSDTFDDVAWYATRGTSIPFTPGNSGNKTHEVGLKDPNGLGLYDMSGNVAEWCWDWYGDYTAEVKTNPMNDSPGSLSMRVRRGGSWADHEQTTRSDRRVRSLPYDRSDNNGIRLVLP